jgi:signal recognition particle subunit SRP54
MPANKGAGKTTTVAKLRRWLQENNKKKVGVVSADVYRPAAIKQLEMLAQDVQLTFFFDRCVTFPKNLSILP